MKYYQIREFETDHPESHDGVVSEEELKRRLVLMFSMFNGENDWPQVLPILFHGSAEKDDEKPWPGPEDIIKMRRGEKGEEPCYVCKQVGNHESWCSRGKPSPAPTREEWEAWAHQLSHKLITKIYASHIAQRADVKDSLLSMPIVPKE